MASQALEACIGLNGPRFQAKRTAEGIASLAAFCRQHQVGLVALEATGGYERLPFLLLWAEKIPCAVANPRSVRRFAEAMGVIEKNDRLDAAVIAWYAETKRLVAQEPPSQALQQLDALVGRLRQLTELLVVQQNQRRLQTDTKVLASIDAVTALLRTQSRQFERDIAELLAADPLWRELDKRMREIKGVADRTVARLLAELPEIGTISAKAISKLVGVAPIARDSGKLSGYRHVRGGRAGVRSALFIVADVVRRFNPDFADFHRRLSGAGKAKKAIRIALAHKLLIRLNAKARDARQNLALAA